MRRSRYGLAAASAISAALLAGCGLESASGAVLTAEPGTIQHYDHLDGEPITVVAKDFTEQLILGNMISTALSVAGFDVTNMSNTPGSFGARQASLDGDADVAPEYTGTGWINYLGYEDPVPGEEEQWQAVLEADQPNGLVWLPPAPMNNTYAFATRNDYAEEHGLETFSDVLDLPPEELTFCVDAEFASRNDGFDPFLEAYDLTTGDLAEVVTMDIGLIYSATAGSDCNFGEVFMTDGRIPGLDLKVLEDDREFFPLYNLSMVVGEEALEQYPEIQEVLDSFTPLLTNETMQELNARVDLDGQDPAIVARDWLVEEGFVTLE
ncbi:MAG: glycine betaine ABC transporter substrate-binding protein [Ancrocorticia sp.]|uniref:glycine betaine ABC transporter substrate-binding protein n=1 Tax=Ancrocorticia sp. TaxID=2593684 RepID=UPI003F8F4D5C